MTLNVSKHWKQMYIAVAHVHEHAILSLYWTRMHYEHYIAGSRDQPCCTCCNASAFLFDLPTQIPILYNNKNTNLSIWLQNLASAHKCEFYPHCSPGVWPQYQYSPHSQRGLVLYLDHNMQIWGPQYLEKKREEFLFL